MLAEIAWLGFFSYLPPAGGVIVDLLCGSDNGIFWFNDSRLMSPKFRQDSGELVTHRPRIDKTFRQVIHTITTMWRRTAAINNIQQKKREDNVNCKCQSEIASWLQSIIISARAVKCVCEVCNSPSARERFIHFFRAIKLQLRVLVLQNQSIHQRIDSSKSIASFTCCDEYFSAKNCELVFANRHIPHPCWTYLAHLRLWLD